MLTLDSSRDGLYIHNEWRQTKVLSTGTCIPEDTFCDKKGLNFYGNLLTGRSDSSFERQQKEVRASQSEMTTLIERSDVYIHIHIHILHNNI